jgi:predicted helicase
MQHFLEGRNIGLIFNRQIVGESVSQFGVSEDLICHGTFYLGNKGQDYLAPLYLRDEILSRGQEQFRSNLSESFLKLLRERLPAEANGLAPEEILQYIYAIVHSAEYRRRYGDLLKMDFARVPVTSNVEMFHSLAAAGSALIQLHLMKGNVKRQSPSYVGRAQPEIEKVSYEEHSVWLDRNQTCGFSGVAESVWNFRIGGYQVCEKWLKDRKGRKLLKDDIEQYQRIVVAIAETIRLMKEIDEVIDEHGGWPAAFSSSGGVEDLGTDAGAGPSD